MFYRQAQRLFARPLLHHHDGAAWRSQTWDETRQMVLAEAAALIRAGVRAGDRVVLIAENRVEWPVSDLAIQSVGAITVPTYAGMPPPLAQGIAADAGAVLAIAGDAKLAAKVPTTSVMRAVVLMDSDLPQWFEAQPSAAELAEIARRLGALRPDDVATVIYTSGTTGEPKGVELAHRSWVDTAHALLDAVPLGESDVALSWLPLSHVFERQLFFVCLAMGGQVYMSRGVDRLVADISEVHPTLMTSVPRVYEKMHAAVLERVRSTPTVRRSLFGWAIRAGSRFAHNHPTAPHLQLQHRLADRLVLHPLRERLVGGRLRMFISGGAALAQDVEEFFWAMGVPIYQGWGLTETCSGATLNTPSAHRFRSVGKPLRGVELKIADDGEILVKSPGNMLGYHNKPEATAEVLKDGWLYSGDIGVIDGDGFLFITDRKKALFKTAVGKYVAPQPLENELMHDPLIERAVVVGDGRPYVTALVVPDWDAAGKAGLDEAAISERVQKAVDAANEGHGTWERIQYFTLLPEDFSEANGELSLKLDVKRKVVQERYQKQIESMYDRKQKPPSPA